MPTNKKIIKCYNKTLGTGVINTQCPLPFPELNIEHTFVYFSHKSGLNFSELSFSKIKLTSSNLNKQKIILLKKKLYHKGDLK